MHWVRFNKKEASDEIADKIAKTLEIEKIPYSDMLGILEKAIAIVNRKKAVKILSNKNNHTKLEIQKAQQLI